MKLMIVESPNKIKKLKGYLGDEWEVAASVGHIRDLPDDEMGVEPPNFRPKYVTAPEKGKVVSQLKSKAKRADEVYLATDPDREGEAIAFHLKQVLQLENPKRITFNEITKSAVKSALVSPTVINDRLVAAQEGRRVLDRIVGYSVSPALSEQSGIPLSGGRVQSPAVKLVVLRENEINEFRKRNYYTVEAVLGDGLSASLDIKAWTEEKYLFEKPCAEAIALHKRLTVTSVETDKKTVKPRAPFTTSSLQQSASSNLKLSPGETMKAAQGLFELGAITYHRTDSRNLSAESFSAVKTFLLENGMPAQDTQLLWSSKGGAQEAHEAIRPSDISLEAAGETEAQKHLYALIRERTLSSAMQPAIDLETRMVLTTVDKVSWEGRAQPAIYVATGKVEEFSGWRNVCQIEKVKAAQSLPRLLDEGEAVTAETKVVTKETQPPSRFSEATLIKAMEKLEIGRPSTYASILENIKSRGYIVVGQGGGKKDDDKLRPTKVGEAVVQALTNMTFMNLDYTRKLESYLDKIEQGKGDYIQLVRSVYDTVSSELKTVQVPLLIETVPCPVCEQAVKQIKKKKGRKTNVFWVHVEEQTDCVKFLTDHKGKPVAPKDKGEEVISDCPTCGEPVVRRYSSGKEFYFWVHKTESDAGACSTFLKDREGVPVTE